VKFSRKISQKGTAALNEKLTKRGEHLQNLKKQAQNARKKRKV